MNVTEIIANDSFAPYRATDAEIQAFPRRNGAVYFAYDTRRIYFDRDNERYQMSNNGILFVDGHAEQSVLEVTDEGRIKFPRNNILADHYDVGSIIINYENTFYRIEELDDLYAYCSRMLIAGSGGGGGGSDDQGSSDITFNMKTVTDHPWGQDLEIELNVTDLQKSPTAIIRVDIYNNLDEYRAKKEPRATCTWTIPTGEWTTRTIEAAKLNAGEGNVLIGKATVDLRESTVRVANVNCLAIKFEEGTSWNPCQIMTPHTSTIQYPYTIKASGSSTIPDGMKVNIVCTLIDGSSNTVYNYPKTTTDVDGFIELNELLSNVGQGGHILTITATTKVNSVDVIIGGYTYGIGVYKGEKGENVPPIIWSPFMDSKADNYTTIKIPYNIYDPNSDKGAYKVQFFINSEEVKTENINYNEGRWNEWSISDYNVDPNADKDEGTPNTFIIQCGLAQKIFNVNIISKSTALDAVKDHLVLYLNARGRSNNELPARRSVWNNRGTATNNSIGLGDVKLNGFNWANNGWKDEDGEGGCLRVSNGASVSIPLKTMANTTAGSFTYEFDFKVRNAANFSRLIVEKTEQMLDDDGNPMYDADGTPITSQIKTVSTGEGAFLTYFNSTNKRGFMLGTQECFFSTSEKSVVNARYVDEKRVKISIVVDGTGALTTVYKNDGSIDSDRTKRLIYLYVNGVLTGIQSFLEDTAFDNGQTELIINSNYCDVDIYNIRVYDKALSYANITQNWIGDAPTLDERWARYNVNNAIVDSKGAIDYQKVLAAKIIPTMVIKTYSNSAVGSETDNKLPYVKGSKKAVGVRFYNPTKDKNDQEIGGFHAENVELDVQGTSSQGYPRRNYKLKTKQKIKLGTSGWDIPYKMEDWDGLETSKDYWYEDHGDSSHTIKKGKYDIGNGIEVREFCLKADYMESSSTHNTQFANFVGWLTEGNHPLNKDFNIDGDMRTTVYGFPMLLFWEDADGNITYVGKYNFNIDKGATDAFGFSCEDTNQYSDSIVHEEVWDKDEENLIPEEEARQSTFAELAECWEFRQNQSGLGKFQGDNFYATNSNGAYSIKDHFEPRYTYYDWDIADVYAGEVEELSDLSSQNAYVKKRTAQLAKMWTWVASTNTAEATNVALDSPVYYKTLSTEFEHGVNYYSATDVAADITLKLRCEDAEKTVTGSKITDWAEVKDGDQFEAFLQKVAEPLTSEEQNAGMDPREKYAGPYSFIKDAEDGKFYYMYGDNQKEEASECGIAVPSTRDSFSIKVSVNWEGFSIDLLERFDKDSIRYRKAKFKNEFSLHFDMEYTTLYFILTELLLCYDSRQKNMMIATWGPTKNSDGNFIWYPIFYDIDTQLGVNNSGYISWDYDTDATQIVTNPDGSYSDKSIFSGAGSVLWINFAQLFESQIQSKYRSLRNSQSSKTISEQALLLNYNTQGSSKWSEIMKNIDSDYKYIAPSVTGYINTQGDTAYSSEYYYCLQGDRALDREAFFRNRINYLDSEWGAGNYFAGTQQSNIQIRYNANDMTKTSDGIKPELEADVTFKLRSYLSQYLSVLFDEIPSESKKFIAGQEEPAVIEPLDYIATRLNEGVPLTQQLIYIRGPKYIEDLGDLSTKYVNELRYGEAKKLRRLELGSWVDGYRNDLFTGEVVQSLNITTDTAKGLFKYMNLTNLSKAAGTLELTGAEKLETFMAMNTQLDQIKFTEGNLLKTLYLPETITNFSLSQPLLLKGLLTTPPSQDNTPEGLYIANWTDKLSTPITASTTSRIETFVLNKTKMGIDSYRLLDYIYRVKEAKFAGVITDDHTSDTLACDFSDVEWSPYVQVEQDTKYDNKTTYYQLENDITYKPITYSADVWNQGLRDGTIFTKDPDFDTSLLTNLDIPAKFVEVHTDLNLAERYKSSAKDFSNEGRRILPTLTGRIHVNNDEEHLVDEYDVWNWVYGQKYYPELEITADYMSPCASVQFVEYKPIEGVEGQSTKVSLGWLKYRLNESKSPVVFNGEEPTRLHRVFQGWAIDCEKLRKQASVITEEDTDITFVSTKDLATTWPSLNGVEGQRLTLVAVYKIKGYTMTFHNYDNSSYATLTAEAGKSPVAPNGIPYKPETESSDEGELKRNECWAFLGWTNTNSSNASIVNFDRITVLGDMDFYAKFEKKSVYENVLPQEYLIIRLYEYEKDIYANAMVDGYTALITLRKDVDIQGRICLPCQVQIEHPTTHKLQWFPVGGFLGTDAVEDSDGVGLIGNDKLTGIFFQGCEAHPKVECKIQQLMNMNNNSKLEWVDIPSSVRTIAMGAFSYCPKLQITDLNQVKILRKQSFYFAATDGKASSLTIPGDTLFTGIQAFAEAGWSSFQLGTMESPLTREALDSLTNTSRVFGVSYAPEDSKLKRINVICDQTILPSEVLAVLSAPDKILNYDYYIEKYPDFINVQQGGS